VKNNSLKKSHDPINKSHRKKIWTLFLKRDQINNLIQCTLCNMPEMLDDNTNDYKMTIGHLNIQRSKYSKYYNSNHEANLTPQHNICNQRLNGLDFYEKHEHILIKVFKSNLAWSTSLSTVRKEKVVELLTESSDITDEKSRLYDGICEKYLHLVLKTHTDEIPFSIAKEDISGICKSQYNFGSSFSVTRHLKTMCNRFNLLYVLEENSDRVKIIRLMRKDERALASSILKQFKTITHSLSLK